MIQFLLNDHLQQEAALPPDTTVLQYLRREAGRCGTKEGCASGDCGACTVVIAEPQGDALRYTPVNACLTFISALQGKQLITVEDLKHQGQLHNVQQAMADNHASQCGFCTPGFVMSVFALQKNLSAAKRGVKREHILQALSGNLCRCTGYRPIVEAAFEACERQPVDQFDRAEKVTLQRLQAIAPSAGQTIRHHEDLNLLPSTVEELAAAYLANPEAKLVAGGTDLALEITQRHRRLTQLITLSHIPAMKTAFIDGEQIIIGAAATLSDCMGLLESEFPDFGALLERFASQQIRNQGTFGGNIANASPIGDGGPVLLALGASLRLRRGSQQRTLPLAQFYQGYKQTALQAGEFIEQILIPRVEADSTRTLKVYKVSKRLDDDISAVCGAFHIEVNHGVVTHAFIAYGGMAAVAKRAEHCEKLLIGQPWQAATVERACQALTHDYQPISDFRASQEYRMQVAKNLLRRCLIETTSTDTLMRVTQYV
ncbi:xanthine dehydrogenase small subunit [Rouxiella sp. S1S-2]|uniref:xanthine dehydrogenase small subunit n=1 Tax=Rouxiella sp. S1S-2 TaxID=2653856 RepID=UPI00126551E1|nr:xanthine dehydrogenase small subunit [Rouxiella sp. S1S-2]KAB7896810.1 xanthine dehydrogenase small subunit [Rouxiella sp. S1S-2]